MRFASKVVDECGVGLDAGSFFREALSGEDQSRMFYTWRRGMQAAGQAELHTVRTRKELWWTRWAWMVFQEREFQYQSRPAVFR